AIIFITHDFGVVARMCDRVAVMYAGRIIEQGDVRDIFSRPAHPYTQALIAAIPEPDPTRKRQRTVLGGDPPSPERPPGGCPFHPRCPKAMADCSVARPAAVNIGTADDPHLVRCHLYGDETGS
ncbi:MAG: peptide ABC transporter ATP-binding protein, partial [Minwuiales bacterium]|nr:peptide ABC transporter ATP-binding protein [Minwuiales bacterium]